MVQVIETQKSEMRFQVLRECLSGCDIYEVEELDGAYRVGIFDDPVDAILFSEQWRDEDHVCWVELVAVHDG